LLGRFVHNPQWLPAVLPAAKADPPDRPGKATPKSTTLYDPKTSATDGRAVVGWSDFVDRLLIRLPGVFLYLRNNSLIGFSS